MQTTKEKLTALTSRVLAADEALKRADNLSTKIAVKEAKITALEASISVCPDGKTKKGLEKRVETLKNNMIVMIEKRDDFLIVAEVAVDLDCTFVTKTVEPAATGTEGGES